MEFDAIGTHWKIDIQDEIPDAVRVGIFAEVMQRINVFDRDYSRFRADSLVTKMSQEAGTYTLPDDASPMMQLYKNAYHITDGAVTPLIGSVMVEAGYDATYSLVPHELHHPPTWEDVMDFKSPKTLVMKQPALLDFGAFGKGYLVDIVGELLWSKGLRSFIINAGGDILYRSATNAPFRVGLEHPQDFSKVIGVATITGGSMCGSAGSRRAWANFHHIINPHTLESPKDILATWAIARTTMLSDALATCLYFVPPEKLLKYYQFEYVVMYADQTIKKSSTFPGEMFVKAESDEISQTQTRTS